MSETSINISNLKVNINGFKILKSINLDFKAGQVIGLLGPSGAGKTTLIRTIVGLQKITDGKATVLGQPAGSGWLRSQIGYMAQDPDVYPDLTVAENINYFAKLVGASSSQQHTVINTVELEPQLNQLVATLSGGQMVRVSLAVALLGNPQVIILDEPTVGLDPILRQKLWQVFHSLARNGKTVIVTSHVMDEAQRCDHLVLIRMGRILAADSPAKLQTSTGSADMEQVFLKLVGGKK